METRQVLANGNETLDYIVYKEYKEDTELLAQVIKLNPHLAHKVFLPAGEKVLLPHDPPKTKPKSVLRIFGESKVPNSD